MSTARSQHHEEGENGEGDVVALAAEREHAYDYAEQCEVNRGRKETAGDDEIVGGEKDEVEDGERSGPGF